MKGLAPHAFSEQNATRAAGTGGGDDRDGRGCRSCRGGAAIRPGRSGHRTLAYIANIGFNTVSVLDTATNTVTTTFPAGSRPFGIALTPDGTRAYVTDINSTSVLVIDTNTVVTTIPTGIGTGTTGLVITPDGSRAYVAVSGANAAPVIYNRGEHGDHHHHPRRKSKWTGGHPGRDPPLHVQVNARHVYVIDTATNMLTTTLTGFDNFPASIAIGNVTTPDFTDLAVTITDSADPAALGDTFTETVTVTNNGPQPATGVSATVTFTGAAGTIFSASSTQVAV